MDSLTHIVAGAHTPVAFRGSPRRAAVIAFGIAAGELSDIDIISEPVPPPIPGRRQWRAGSPHFSRSRFFLLTEPFCPFVRKGVIDQDDSWCMDVVSLFDPGNVRFDTVYAKP